MILMGNDMAGAFENVLISLALPEHGDIGWT